MSGTSIPLQGLNPDMGAAVTQGIGNAQNLLGLQEQFRQVKRQNALRGILGAPGAIDQTGQPTSETMERVMGVDPEAGLKLRQNALVTQEQKLRMQVLNTDSFAKTMGLIGDTYAPVVEGYEEELRKGTPPEAAAAHAQEGMNKAYETLSHGALTPEQLARVDRKFDPVRLRQVIAGSKQYEQMRKDRLAEAAEQRAETRLDEQGWKPLFDVANPGTDGQPTEVRYNAGKGQTTTLDGKPYKPANPMRLSDASAQAKEYDKPILMEWTGEDGKKHRQTLEQDKSRGGWVDAATRHPVQVGTDMREIHPGEISKTAGGIDEETASRLALQMAKGQPPGQMMGIRNQADIDKVQNALTKVYADQGKTPEEAASLASQASARWHAMVRTYDQFISGGQGTPAGQLVSLNTSIQHIEIARQAIDALKNGKMPIFNQLTNRLAQETGDPAPTNMDALSQFVANEVSRASAGAALTGEERSAMTADIGRNRSPAQLRGALDKFQQLLAGKAVSLKNQYEFGTGIKDPKDPYAFNHLLLPETLKVLGWDKKGADTQQQPAQAPPGVWQQGQPIPPQAIEMLKASPGTAQQFEHTFGPGSAQQYLKSAPSTAPTTESRAAPPAEAQTYPVPEAYKDRPDGTTFNKGALVKRGDKLVPNTANDQSADVQAAKDAISKGADKQKIIERLRKAYPDIDTKGL